MFGSNDGMFHVLDARVGVATKRTEIFAYVPRSQYVNLKELTAPTYTHRYFVDGPVVEGDIWNGTDVADDRDRYHGRRCARASLRSTLQLPTSQA